MKISGYFIFLVPEAKVGQELESQVERLAAQHGGTYFPPHITLLGDIPLTTPESEVIEKAKQLAEARPAFDVTFEGVGTEDEFYRSLYITVRHDQPLMDLNKSAQEAFSLRGEYFPHLSLAYGNIAPEKKQAMLATVPNRAGRRVRIDRIDVYKIDGYVDDWKKLWEFRLAS